MLAGFRDRARQGIGPPGQAWPDTDGQQILALASQNSETRTVSLVMDATTASIAMFAIAAYAGDREAHVREAGQYGGKLPRRLLLPTQPPGRRRPRDAGGCLAASRRTAYRMAIEHDAMAAPERSTPNPSAGQAADREMELE